MNLVAGHHREKRPAGVVGAHVVVPEGHDHENEHERDQLPDTGRFRGRDRARYQV